MEVEQAGGYEYLHTEDKVAVLPYRGDEYLLRKEICPAWGSEPRICTLTGTIETSRPMEDALRELYEEAGFQVLPDHMEEYGDIRPVKSSDQVVYLYGVDVSGVAPEKPPGDGSALEDHARCLWVDDPSVSVDPYATYILCMKKPSSTTTS